MFTSETERERTHFFKAGYIYLIIAVFCALFGAVYEHFSHGVYSYYMIYAFSIPLILGTVPYFTMYYSNKIKLPCRLAENLYNAGIATLTTGSIVQGILVIYGTTNNLTLIYLISGIGLIVSAGVIYTAKHLCIITKIKEAKK